MSFDPQRRFIKHVALVDILNKINFAVGTSKYQQLTLQNILDL